MTKWQTFCYLALCCLDCRNGIELLRGKKKQKIKDHMSNNRSILFFFSLVLCNLYTQINDVRLMRDAGERDWALKHQRPSKPSGTLTLCVLYFSKCVYMFIVCIRLSDDGRVFITCCLWRLLAIGGYQRQLTTRSIESISFVSDESISTQTKTLNRPKYIDPPSAGASISLEIILKNKKVKKNKQQKCVFYF